MARSVMIAVALALALSACSTSAAVEAPATPEARYLLNLKAHGVVRAGVEDAVMVELGKATCRALDRGAAAGQVEPALTQGGRLMNSSEAGVIAGAAVAEFCPNQRGKIA